MQDEINRLLKHLSPLQVALKLKIPVESLYREKPKQTYAAFMDSSIYNKEIIRAARVRYNRPQAAQKPFQLQGISGLILNGVRVNVIELAKRLGKIPHYPEYHLHEVDNGL